MFSFFKKLFNFQKTDTNSDKKEKEVELKSNDANATLEDIRIRDTDLIRRLQSNENYRRSEPREYNSFSSFHSNETASTSSDTDLIRRFQSNENYRRSEPREYSSFSSFQSNETASTSLESNVHASLDNPINTIHKSQRRSSKLATKKITKMADRLSQHSDVEFSDEGDNITVESSVQKIESSEEAKVIKKSNKVLNRKSIRFCQKCKLHKTIVGHITKRKLCDICGNILFYQCSYCKKKYYASHKGWQQHEFICNAKETALNLVNVSNESVLNQCSDPNFKVFNEKSGNFNIIMSENTTDLAEKQLEALENTIGEKNAEEKTKKVLGKKAITSKKQKKPKSFKRWMRRYCEKCHKTVNLVGISKIRSNTKCGTCRTLLKFMCVKCHAKYNSKAEIDYHFQSKCLPINYKCSKCNFHSTTAKSLSFHVKIKHPIVVYCDMCSYQSPFKSNLLRHINSIHLKKLLFCQNSSFTATKLKSLRRHEQTSHSSQ